MLLCGPNIMEEKMIARNGAPMIHTGTHIATFMRNLR
jgi:hypothetical protein